MEIIWVLQRRAGRDSIRNTGGPFWKGADLRRAQPFWKGLGGGGYGTCTRRGLDGKPAPALCTPN
jgi:hypothetical protein